MADLPSVAGPRSESARALLNGPPCPVCGASLSPRQRRACSPRCRAALSRQRKAEALAAYVARLEAAVQQLGGDPSTMVPQPDPWRFRVSPPGRRFGWRGQVYASDPETGLIEVSDPEFAFALRRLARRDAIQELGSTEGLDTTEERG